jgi:hypothetical protein
MANWLKRLLTGILITLVIGAGGWYFLVTSYSAELTTENEILIEDSTYSVSNQSNDELATVSFSYGEDNLEWSKLVMSISQNGTQYDCTKSGLTSSMYHGGPIQSKLNSDGNSFTIEANSDSEDFILFSFSDMQQTNDTNYSIRFSKTDIFFGENISGFISEEEFQNVNAVPTGEPTESSEARLEWYDYDLSVHRVIPKQITYIANESNMFYKMQFLSYYNSEDETRHISFIISSIGDIEAPAIQNENLTKEAGCIISSVNQSAWMSDETIFIYENGFNICSSSCTLEVEIRYLNQIVKGIREIIVD